MERWGIRKKAVLAATLAAALVLATTAAALAWPFLAGYDGYHLANRHLNRHYGSTFNTSGWKTSAGRAVSTWTTNDGTPFEAHYDTASPNHFNLRADRLFFASAYGCLILGTVPPGGYDPQQQTPDEHECVFQY